MSEGNDTLTIPQVSYGQRLADHMTRYLEHGCTARTERMLDAWLTDPERRGFEDSPLCDFDTLQIQFIGASQPWSNTMLREDGTCRCCGGVQNPLIYCLSCDSLPTEQLHEQLRRHQEFQNKEFNYKPTISLRVPAAMLSRRGAA